MTGRRSALLAVTLLAAAALSCQHERATPAAEPAPADPVDAATATPVAVTELFELWSDLDVNLHHFLYAWARQERPLERWRVLEVAERDELEDLEPADRAAWSEAVSFYRREIASRDLLFGAGMEELRDVLAGIRADGLDDEPRRVAEILERARPIYRDRWWPRHDQANRDWVEALVPALRRHEAEISARLAAAWNAEWPKPKIRADVTPYPYHLGAYTSGKPHITISSSDPGYRMPNALEMIFHETSHGEFLSRPLHLHLQRAFGYSDRSPPRGFWHLTLFYTAGEVTRQVLAEAGEPDYEHVGRERIYVGSEDRRRQTEALDRHWRSYLAGEMSNAARAEALAAIVDDLTSPSSDSPR